MGRGRFTRIAGTPESPAVRKWKVFNPRREWMVAVSVHQNYQSVRIGFLWKFSIGTFQFW